MNVNLHSTFPPVIELKKVGKKYGGKSILSDITVRIDPGEFVCITGPSGAGKSTLLHLLTGAEAATTGEITIDGVNLRQVPPVALQLFRRRIGIVFQDYKLLKNRTVAENIAYPLEVCGVSDKEIDRRVRKALALTGMTNNAATLSFLLSGGEKARTAIARAVVHDPMIVLADEPTGNVDPGQSVQIMNLFKEINESGTTVILATHDSGLVDAIKPRVIELQNGSIVRDSVGSYSRASKHPIDESTTKGKHHILDDQVAKRKVKVTGIG